MKPGGSLRIALWLTLFVFSTSCGQKNESEKSKSELQRAYGLIDKQRHEEAISLLEDLYSRSPDSKEIRLALGSAYSGLAGFQVFEFYDMYNAFLALQKQQDGGSRRDEEGRSPLESKVDDAIGLLKVFMSVLGAFNLVEVLDDQRFQALIEADRILSGLGDMSRGERLYRALIRIVLLKTILIEDFVSKLEIKNVNGRCQVGLGKAQPGLERAIKILMLSLTDLKSAYPRDQEKIEEIGGTVQVWQKSILSSNEALEAMGRALSYVDFSMQLTAGRGATPLCRFD